MPSTRPARRASCSSIEREQAERLGFVGHQPREGAGEADGVGAQSLAHEIGAARGRVALVEQEVEHRQRRPQALGQQVGGRHAVRDAGVADLALRRAPGVAPSWARERGTPARSRRVVRPARVRNVSATCASRLRAGWQQVKISRRRSSSTPPSSLGSSGVDSTATSCSLAAPVAVRRNRSSARLRAVVVSQAPGLRGMPSRLHRSSARVNASCAHSSARSQSPVNRIRVATTRPHSSRNALATAASTSGATCPRSAAPRSSRAAPPGSSPRARWPRRGRRTRPGTSLPSAPWSPRTDRRR